MNCDITDFFVLKDLELEDWSEDFGLVIGVSRESKPLGDSISSQETLNGRVGGKNVVSLRFIAIAGVFLSDFFFSLAFFGSSGHGLSPRSFFEGALWNESRLPDAFD